MQNQFNPGDLALIIGSGLPGNIGKVVRLVSYMAPHGDWFVCGGLPYRPREHSTWIVESPDGRSTLLTISRVDGSIHTISTGPCRQSWLMPLRDDHTPQLEKQKGVEHG